MDLNSGQRDEDGVDYMWRKQRERGSAPKEWCQCPYCVKLHEEGECPGCGAKGWCGDDCSSL